MTVPQFVAVLAGLLLTAACVGATPAPQPVTLGELVTEADRFDGRRVVAEGIVRRHADPPHAWLEDADVNRVELDPDDVVVGMVGSTIRVTGVFRAPGDRGRVIEVEDVEVLRAPARAAAHRSDDAHPVPAGLVSRSGTAGGAGGPGE